MEDKRTKWSRDWSKFNWEDISTKLMEYDVANMGQEEKEKIDIGITMEEFVEYLEWQNEYAPEEYWKNIFSLKLRELGFSIEEVQYFTEHPEEFTGMMEKWCEREED